MGMLEFVILAIVVCIIAAAATWALRTFVPGVPAIVYTLIWGVAIGIIIWTLLQATGVLRHDPKIPSL